MGSQQSQPQQQHLAWQYYATSVWGTLTLHTRQEIAGKLRELLQSSSEKAVAPCVLLVCEPAPEVLASLSAQAALRARRHLPDASTPGNVMCSCSKSGSASDSAAAEQMLAEAVVLALLHPYMQRDEESGVCILPGVFALRSDATVGQLKMRIRHRYHLDGRAPLAVFFEEQRHQQQHQSGTEEGGEEGAVGGLSMVTPLDTVTLTEACRCVHQDGFVYCVVVMEGMYGRCTAALCHSERVERLAPSKVATWAPQ
ncbi:hypothetical protein DQ04_13271010 [Trypanosoma grayi]|uniref:hypothetical protein n=1 Tax=Trypanosoma grayi TaxID=71804 RepID=UPI0004F49628|nr:hypothetical protein DQ04_13271010 [Trypanosoma grayi]KEG06576.1 hypothetical protein DQ04_13271010 [Trypanosoma grayi]